MIDERYHTPVWGSPGHMSAVLRHHHLQVKEALPHPSSEPTYPFKPGDMVMVREIKDVSLRSRWTEPHIVLLVTLTAVKVQGRPEWLHSTRCRAAPTTSEAEVPITDEHRPPVEQRDVPNKGETDHTLPNSHAEGPSSSVTGVVTPTDAVE